MSLILLTAKKKFTPLALFRNSEQGAWYDPSDLTTLFQDSAGTTPVTLSPMEQPVGLMLDKSKGLALGAELVTNGDFSNGTTGWTLGSGITVVNAQLNINVSTWTNATTSIPSLVAGKTYKISFDVISIVSSGILSWYLGAVGTAASITATTTGRKSGYITLNGAATLYFGSISFNGVLDNISLVEVPGNHAFQATAPNRPLLSARVNLLTYTEDFSNAVWGKSGATTTVNTITATVGGGSVIQSIPSYASIIKFSVLFKVQKTVGETKFPMFSLGLTGGTSTYGQVILNTNTGVATKRSVAGIDNLPTDIFSIDKTTYWQLSYNVESRTGNIAGELTVYPAASINGTTYDGTLVGSVTVLGADLRPTNSGALLPPYQRVTTATDYDIVGFPLYLKCNGSSSAMSTNSINFTGTDKMTVVTGVRKLSDALGGLVCELSTTSVSNNGVFTLLSPDPSQTNYGWYSKGTIRITANASPYVSPISNIVTGIGNISAPLASVRVNGIVTSDTNSQGSGTYGNYPLYLFARAGTSFFFNGQFYGAIIRGAQSDTVSVTQTENYMAQKTGITF